MFYNVEGNIVYITAALGVILNKYENTQVFFGAGEVENRSKQVANDSNGHNNYILSL